VYRNGVYMEHPEKIKNGDRKREQSCVAKDSANPIGTDSVRVVGNIQPKK